MKKVISMNLINVIQMKTQSFWLTALLVLLGVFFYSEYQRCRKVNGWYRQSEYNPA